MAWWSHDARSHLPMSYPHDGSYLRVHCLTFGVYGDGERGHLDPYLCDLHPDSTPHLHSRLHCYRILHLTFRGPLKGRNGGDIQRQGIKNGVLT